VSALNDSLCERDSISPSPQILQQSSLFSPNLAHDYNNIHTVRLHPTAHENGVAVLRSFYYNSSWCLLPSFFACEFLYWCLPTPFIDCFRNPCTLKHPHIPTTNHRVPTRRNCKFLNFFLRPFLAPFPKHQGDDTFLYHECLPFTMRRHCELTFYNGIWSTPLFFYFPSFLLLPCILLLIPSLSS